MNLEAATAITITTIAAIIGSKGILAWRYHRIMRLIALRDSFPADSRHRDVLQEVIDQQTDTYIGYTRYNDREPFVVPCLIFGLLLSTGLSAWWIFTLPFDMSIRVSILAMLAIVMMLIVLRNPQKNKK